MKFEFRERNGQRIYPLNDEILAGSIRQLEEELAGFVQSSDDDLTLDFSEVHKIDSMSIAMIIRIRRDLLEGNRNLSISNPNDVVVRVLEIAGLGDYL